MIKRYLVKFTRFYYYITPMAHETVWVVLETKLAFCNDTIEKWEEQAWNALWAQYPLWNCPFNQSNPCKTTFDKIRYGWSSPFIGEHIKL